MKLSLLKLSHERGGDYAADAALHTPRRGAGPRFERRARFVSEDQERHYKRIAIKGNESSRESVSSR